LEKPENRDQTSPPRKNPENRKTGGQTRRPREKEKLELRENGGQTNGGQTRRPRGQENPEFPENGGQANGGQAAHPALDLINSNLRKFSHGGAVVATWHHYRGHKLGPYYNFRYREEGRVRQVYLGREGPQVQAVRDRVTELHQALARYRLYQREAKRAGRQIRAHRAEAKRRLAAVGLSLQGLEIRGWRARRSPKPGERAAPPRSAPK
jgi:hypothetical protein